MFKDIDRREWVLNSVSYQDKDDLGKNLGKLLARAERLLATIIERKAKKIVETTPIQRLGLRTIGF